MLRFTARRRVALVTTAVIAGSAVIAPARVNAAQNDRTTCTATIVTTQLPSVSTFQTTFSLTPTTPYVEDRSTVLRADTLRADLVGAEVQLDYFKDTSVFDSVQLDVTVPLQSGRGRATGRTVAFTVGRADRETTYDVVCDR